MIANILIIMIIVFWVGFVIFSVLRKRKKEKKTGIPMGCYSCPVLKNGKCPKHCEAKK